MTELPRKAVARTARLAALPLGYAGRNALGLGKRLTGRNADAVMTEIQQRTAEQLFRTLGELKGGAMKFGQAMSVLEAALPDELGAPYRAELTRLQDSAPPMPTQTVRDQIAADLGADWRDELVWLDGGPTAAASIGQVHLGRWSDDRDVAVKVQYPGAGDALRSDLRQLARLARTIGPMAPGIDVKPLIAELQARANDELDYTLEAEAQRAFAQAFRGDPEIVVPDVVAVGEHVLVTEWLESPASLASVIESGTQEERDHYGELFVRFLFSGPARTGMLHADPHPGNFRILPNADGSPGRLGVLDYGAVARLPGGALPQAMGALIRIAGPPRPRRAGRRAPGGGLHPAGGQARPAAGARLPRAVRGADPGRALPLLAGVDAGAVPAAEQPQGTDVHPGAQAQPAARLPADPPHLAGWGRGTQPARRRGAVPRDPAGVPAWLRRRRSDLRSAPGTSRAGRPGPCVVERKAPGTVPTISKPSACHRWTAAVLVSTTALNWMPANPCSRCHATTYDASARPTPRPCAAGSTMNDAVPTWSPRPGRLGPILALPRIRPSSSSTTVSPGGCSIHQPRPVSTVRSSGKA